MGRNIYIKSENYQWGKKGSGKIQQIREERNDERK